MSTTQDPNHPVDSGNEVAPWSGEAANTPGSQDTELVAGHSGPTTKESAEVDSSYTNASTKDTEGIYQSPGYRLGAEEDDSTNPTTLAPNTNSGQSGVPYTKYDGTVSGASAAATVVPGDTEFAYGHAYNPATDGNATIPPTQPGAKQPDIDGGTYYVGNTHGDTSGFLDTNPWATGFPGDGVGGLSGNEVPLGTGLYASFYGQANNASQVLDTTNTSNPTDTVANDGSGFVPTAVDLLGGSSAVKDTLYGYPGLTAGSGVTAPGIPTAVSWTFHAGSAEVTWTAPVLTAPVQANPVGSTTGGTLAANTYFYVITALDALGQTTASNEKSLTTTGTTSSVALSWAAVTGATGYKVYRGTVTGTENKLIATLGAVTSTTDTGAVGTTVSPPLSNTATSAGGGHIREYIVYGWRVSDAAHLPSTTSAANAYLTNGVLPTVTAHSRGVTKFGADGSTTVEVPMTRLRIEHLTPGDFYFFRVAARNEVATGTLSAISGVTYPTNPAMPTYFLSEQKLDGTQVTVPSGTLPEGEALAALTFTNQHGTDDAGTNLTGESGAQLAEPGEEGEDRI